MATTVIHASAIWTGGADPKTIYDHDLVIENGVVFGVPQSRSRSRMPDCRAKSEPSPGPRQCTRPGFGLRASGSGSRAGMLRP